MTQNEICPSFDLMFLTAQFGLPARSPRACPPTHNPNRAVVFSIELANIPGTAIDVYANNAGGSGTLYVNCGTLNFNGDTVAAT